MSEVSIKLAGGLGNYMFQIAAAYAYGLKYNKKAIFTFESSFVVHKHITTYKNNILNNVELINNKPFFDFKLFNENGFHYNEIPSIDGDVYLNGYFQTEKYFKEYSDEIRKLFSYPDELISSAKEKMADKYGIYETFESSCSIHVRRGDYLNSPNHHPVQNMNYYMKAIKKMPKDSIFLIFSDDISWCKVNFPDVPEKFIFVEGNTDYEDLLLMSLCKNNITCNSTFSWWAAWLNNNPNKKVTIPSTWFGPAYANYNTEDLYCEGWVKI